MESQVSILMAEHSAEEVSSKQIRARQSAQHKGTTILHHQQTLPHPTIRRVRCQEIILSLAQTHAVMAKLLQTFASRTQHNQEEVYL